MAQKTQDSNESYDSALTLKVFSRVFEFAAEQYSITNEQAMDASHFAILKANHSWSEALVHAASSLHLHAMVCTATGAELQHLLRTNHGIFVCRTASGYWILYARKAIYLDTFHEHSSTQKFRQFLQSQSSIVGVFLQPQLSLQSLQQAKLKSFRLWTRVFALLRMERNDLLVLLIFAFVIGGLTLAVPITVQVLVNIVAFGAVLQPLVVLLILLSGVLIFAGVLQLLETYIVEILQRRFFVRVAEDFSRRLPKIRLDVFKKYYGPELVNRFFDVITVQKSLSALLMEGLALALQTIVGLILLGFYHPLLLAFDLLLIVALVIVFLLGRGAGRSAIQESTAKYQVAAWLENIARNPLLFRLGKAGEVAAQRASLLTSSYLQARKQHFNRILRQIGGGLFVQAFSMILLLGVGGFLVIERQLTLGQLVAAELVVSSIGYGFAKLGRYMEKGYDLVAAIEKIGTVIDLPMETQTTELGLPQDFALSLPVRAKAKAPQVLHQKFTLRSGQHLAIAQDSYAQGRLLLKQILGLEPSDTSITVGGLDLSSIYQQELRQKIFLIHHPEFVDGTMLDNIRVVAPSLHPAQAHELLQIVQLETTIQRLSEGVQTKLVAHPDILLSLEEGRRLMIARALAASPKLLLVDGGLDHLGLSSADKHELLKYVLGKDVPWTAIVISKDQDVLAACTSSLTFIEGEWQLQ